MDNPKLNDVLIQDYRNGREQFDIIGKIRTTKSKDEKAKLTTDLEKLVNQRYDLKVKIKEIEYQQLIDRLEELKKTIEKSKDDLGRWQNVETKKVEVKKQLDFLLSEPNRPPFGWR